MTDGKKYIWPGLMLLASCLNVAGSVTAVAIGAHKNESGEINPFFFMAMTTSSIYAAANSMAIYQIRKKQITPIYDEEEGGHVTALKATRSNAKGLQQSVS